MLAACPEGSGRQFRCDDGRYIPEEWKCDGETDCADHSDEAAELCDGKYFDNRELPRTAMQWCGIVILCLPGPLQ